MWFFSSVRSGVFASIENVVLYQCWKYGFSSVFKSCHGTSITTFWTLEKKKTHFFNAVENPHFHTGEKLNFPHWWKTTCLTLTKTTVLILEKLHFFNTREYHISHTGKKLHCPRGRKTTVPIGMKSTFSHWRERTFSALEKKHIFHTREWRVLWA